MRNPTNYLLLSFCILIGACTNTENPQLAMCQAVTKQLVGNTVSNWDNINQSDSTHLRTIDIKFTQASGEANTVLCTFPINRQGQVDTGPNVVALNGRNVGTKELFKAGAKASKELLKGTAANTVARSKELASDAKVLASDAAVKARESAAEASKLATDMAGKVRESTAGVTAGATVLAGELAGKAKEGALEATQIATEAAEKAKEKALEATQILQQKLEN